MPVRACFVSASGQNAFFAELLSALRGGLEEAGMPTEEAVDHFPPVEDDLVYVLVPHEYLALTYPEAHPDSAQIGRTVVLNTEQPGTHWFDENAIAATHAGVAVDINPMGAEELTRQGVSARLLRLGYVPSWDRWGGRAAPRPVDFTFLGGYNQRRARVLAACGPVLHRPSRRDPPRGDGPAALRLVAGVPDRQRPSGTTWPRRRSCSISTATRDRTSSGSASSRPWQTAAWWSRSTRSASNRSFPASTS